MNPKASPSDDRFLTTGQLSKLVGMNPVAITEAMARGELRCANIGTGKRRHYRTTLRWFREYQDSLAEERIGGKPRRFTVMNRSRIVTRKMERKSA